jgi:hypothetical protein
MLDAYIYDGLRTPFWRHAGAIALVHPLGASGVGQGLAIVIERI